MKKMVIILCAVLFLGLNGFVSPRPVKTGINGVIDPPDGVRKIWAVNGTDSFSTVPATGSFYVEVKPGTWKLFVESVKPYKNEVVENILVQEGQSTDVGVIKLKTE